MQSVSWLLAIRLPGSTSGLWRRKERGAQKCVPSELPTVSCNPAPALSPPPATGSLSTRSSP